MIVLYIIYSYCIDWHFWFWNWYLLWDISLNCRGKTLLIVRTVSWVGDILYVNFDETVQRCEYFRMFVWTSCSRVIFLMRDILLMRFQFIDIQWSDEVYWRLMWLLKINVGYEWNLYSTTISYLHYHMEQVGKQNRKTYETILTEVMQSKEQNVCILRHPNNDISNAHH